MIFRWLRLIFTSLHEGRLKDGRTILQGINAFCARALCIILKDETCFWKNSGGEGDVLLWFFVKED